MDQADIKTEIEALERVLEALVPLEPGSRDWVLDAALKRLGAGPVSPLAHSATSDEAKEPERRYEGPSSGPADIRTLNDEKQPGSAR